MYVRSARACDQPNSASPMTAADIAAQDAMVARFGAQFTTGARTLNDLITALGGNPATNTLASGGVPTVGTIGPGPFQAPAGGPSLPTYGRPVPRYVRTRVPGGGADEACLPRMVPVSKVVALPVIVTPAASPAATLDPNSCTTGNLCLDLLNGCVSSTQVTPEQQLACSLAGYAGNRNRYPAIAALPNKPFLGSVDLHPVRYDPVGMGDVSAPLTPGSSLDFSPSGSLLGGFIGLQVPNWLLYGGTLAVLAIARGSFGAGKRERRY